jgi:hypothetical protein
MTAHRSSFVKLMNVVAISAMLATTSCAQVAVPDSRNVNIPAPTQADERRVAVNERPDSVMYLPLGEDVLVPEMSGSDVLPSEMVGPFELRGETLAGALQLILADYDVSLAFETQEGLNRKITVSNLRGDLSKVVHEVCSLADMYCSYEDGTITVKDTQTFTVTLPPIGGREENTFLNDVSTGLAAILGGEAPIVDPTTRTIVYTATQRTADIADRYFQRLRANTAMIVFETYIWEVSLNSGNSMGVDWSALKTFGKFNTGLVMNGSVGADFTDPISIGLPTTQDFTGTSGDLVRFLAQFGAVKTISQPQITVLSGSEAELRVADTQNYVSQIATTLDEGQATTSVNTDSVDTGFTLNIGSTWDKSTVYANVNIELTDVKQIDDFTFSDSGDSGGSTTIQLPQTSERQLSTQIRVRPGDSLLIAGLVREGDNFDKRGLGLMDPIVPDSRTAQTENLELVILLRPRVVVYTAANDKRYVDYAMKKHKLEGMGVEKASPKPTEDPVEYKNKFPAASTAPRSSATSAFTPLPEDVPPSPVPMTPSKEGGAVAPVTAPIVLTPPVEKKTEVSPAPSAVPAAATSAAPVATTTKVTTTANPVSASAPAPETDAPATDATRFRLGSGFTSKDSFTERKVTTTPSTSSSASVPPATTKPVTVPTTSSETVVSPFDLPEAKQSTASTQKQSDVSASKDDDGDAAAGYDTFDYMPED